MKPITTKNAFSIGLPKWPQMLVKGDTIPVELAKEIIFATDDSLRPSSWMGNDRNYRDKFRKMCGYDLITEDDRAYDPNKTEEQKKAEWKRMLIGFEAQHDLAEEMNFLTTEYVNNTWGSSAYIFGPHGWCHPNGVISYVDNIGKWPSVEEVYKEWSAIAKRWPMLNIYVTLMTGEGSEDHIRPAVTFRIRSGRVRCYEGTLEPFKDRPASRGDNELTASLTSIISGNYRRERGLPDAWMQEFADMVRPVSEAVAKKHGLI